MGASSGPRALLLAVCALLALAHLGHGSGSPPLDYFVYTSQLATASQATQSVSSLQIGRAHV